MISYLYLSDKNSAYATKKIKVLNGETFIALKLNKQEMNSAANVIYLHRHKFSKRCYIGITIMKAVDRWGNGHGYRLQRYFGNAIAKYGWNQFDHYILAFADNREDLEVAEVQAIEKAGGHKSKHTYNLTSGGDLVSENNKKIVGTNLDTGIRRDFFGGVEAAKELGITNSDMPMAIARGERTSLKAPCGNWYFSFDSEPHYPPELWGEALRTLKVQERWNEPVLAVNIETEEEVLYPSGSEAARKLGISQTAVSRVICGKALSNGGYWFKFPDSDAVLPTKFCF